MSKCNYYENAVREDFECPNAGVTLEYIRSAQADLNDLHSALAAAIARAEAAEAKLAAVPGREINGLLRVAGFLGVRHLPNTENVATGMDTIDAWLAQQSEVQS